MRKIAWVGAALIGVALLTACQQKPPAAKETTLKVMAGDVIATMDPAKATDVISAQTMANVYAGLYRYEGKRLVPDMAAKRATVSADQLTYDFTLRKDAKWSDGQPVTAQDFVYAWRRVVDPHTQSQYAYLFEALVNAPDIMSGKKPASALGVQAVSKHHLRVKLTHVVPYFEPLMTLKTFYPVQKRQVVRGGDKYGTSMKTLSFNGPYVLKDWQDSSNTWTVTKNPRYWNHKKVHVDKIKTQVVKENTTALNLFQDGQLDDVTVTGAAAKQMQGDEAYNVQTQNAVFYLELNAARVPAFKNVQVRHALSKAIDRETFINQVLGDGSLPAISVIPRDMSYAPNDGKDFNDSLSRSAKSVTRYDLKAARAQFAAGMAALGQKNLTFTVTSDDTDGAKDTVAFLQQAFSKLSSDNARVTVKTQSLPFKTRLARSAAHQLDVVVSAWGANYPDPTSFLELFQTGNTYNSGNWSNAQYDKLVQAADRTGAGNARWRAMQSAADILTENVGVIPFYQRGAAHLTNPAVKGLTLSPNGMVNYVTVTKNAK